MLEDPHLSILFTPINLKSIAVIKIPTILMYTINCFIVCLIIIIYRKFVFEGFVLVSLLTFGL